MAIAAERNSDLLIDGMLAAGGAGRFPTVNPATEEVLGTAANADAADMDRAIEAARRAFDSTDWATDTELRVRCIRQLRDAMREHVEELRDITMAEVGAPRMLTAAAQLEGPVADLSFSADTAGVLPVAGPIWVWPRRWGSGPSAPWCARPSASSARSPVELSPSDQPGQDRSGTGGRQYRRTQTGT